ncbi:hypothetical protein L9F63_013935 [Diploptera punctata]|uniref:EMI domain-containing protein n=1 Tax=Diploptera punctata TaxID=6984 RepID=A0AAD8EL81_DIPPU|nr:hypothetical protein L9F63_013935 [Diploptera punctata]
MLSILYSLCLIFISTVSAFSSGICFNNVMYTRHETYTYIVTYVEWYRGWCWSGSCDKSRIATKTKYDKRIVQDWRYEKGCCSGYRQSGEDCIPICSSPCIMENVHHLIHALAIKDTIEYHPMSANHCVKEAVRMATALLLMSALATVATTNTLTNVHPSALTVASTQYVQVLIHVLV